MSKLMQSVDDRTQLAGTNRLEVLLFSLGTNCETGRDEVFGINVFKVREVMHVPPIAHAPNMPAAVEGMVSLRGVMVPVVDLAKFCGVQTASKPQILMVTEYNKHIQGFLVHGVDTIERLNWEDVKAPPSMLASQLGGVVTAVAEVEGNRLAMIMDVERILSETAGFYEGEDIYEGIERRDRGDEKTVLFADDSSVARGQIARTLEHMGVRYIGAINGADAWRRLEELADQAAGENRPITDYVSFVLTDVEMPEMDGYVLTRRIKADPRFQKLPVVMHSSLTAEANRSLGKAVGADAYVPKFEPRELAATLENLFE